MNDYTNNFNTIKSIITDQQITMSLRNRDYSFSTFSRAMSPSIENNIIKIGKLLKEKSVHSDMDIQDIYWVLLYLFYSEYRHIDINSAVYIEKDIEKSSNLHYLIYSEGGYENLSSGVTIQYTDELGFSITEDLYKYINEKLNTNMGNRGGKRKVKRKVKVKITKRKLNKNKKKSKKYKK